MAGSCFLNVWKTSIPKLPSSGENRLAEISRWAAPHFIVYRMRLFQLRRANACRLNHKIECLSRAGSIQTSRKHEFRGSRIESPVSAGAGPHVRGGKATF